MTILVAYATEHGSTRTVAERIAVRLRKRGHVTELRSLTEASELADHEAVVLGSAVHTGAWLPVAADFVRGHRVALSGRPVWMFSVGMTAALRGPMRLLAEHSEQKPILRLREEIRPQGYRRFSGVIRPSHLDRTGRVVFRLLGGRYGDFRDWPGIDTWADDIAGRLTD
ncbi:flavodoxin domain-containing protein [Streptomyces sp. NPDC054796]